MRGAPVIRLLAVALVALALWPLMAVWGLHSAPPEVGHLP